MPLPVEVKRVKDILEKNREIFIETGFYKGDGAQTALEFGFRKIYSIEIDDEACKKGNVRFKNKIKSARIRLIRGKSEEVLPNLMNKIKSNSRITFWLDAHERRIQNFENKCPLYTELAAIGNHHIKNHIIMIDDFRQINEQENDWTTQVNSQMIIKMIKAIQPNYIIEEIEYVRHNKTNSILVAYVD